jgi:MFS transporter, DHA2 family, multidrug resistance protein
LSGWKMIVLPQLIRGVGLGLLMAPLLTAALNAIPRNELPMASSFLNVSQNVGGSLGIAILNNHVTNMAHLHAARLGEAFPVQSQSYFRFAMSASHLLFYKAQGVLASPVVKAAFGAASSILRRSQVLGFQDGFVFAGLFLMAGIPFCLLLQPSAHHHHRRRSIDAKDEANALPMD